MPDGRALNSFVFQWTIRTKKGMWEHQFVQKKVGELEVNIVADEKFTKKESKSIERELKALGLKKVSIHLVKSIPKTAAGKHKSFISLLKT